jgi:predicted TIM-barrel enzyme
MLAPRTLAESARRACKAGADAIVVTGTRTGEPPSPDEVRAAQEGAGGCPVLVGSGLDPGNAAALLPVADGAIVGTSLMLDGRATPEQVSALTAARA